MNKAFFMEMKIKIDAPVVAYKDNQSTVVIAKNEGYQSRAKKIDIRDHFVRDQVKTKVIRLEYIEPSHSSGFITKATLTKMFQFLVAKLNVRGALMMNTLCTLKRRDEV